MHGASGSRLCNRSIPNVGDGPLPLTFRARDAYVVRDNNWAVLQGTTSCAQEAKGDRA